MTNQLEHVCVSERDRKRELEVLIMINYHHYTVSNILVILHNFFQRQFLLFLLDLTLSLMCLPTNLYTVPGSPGNIFKRQTAKLFMTFRGRQSRNREHTQDNSTKIWACTLAWTCKLREESQMRDLLQTMAKQTMQKEKAALIFCHCLQGKGANEWNLSFYFKSIIISKMNFTGNFMPQYLQNKQQQTFPSAAFVFVLINKR